MQRVMVMVVGLAVGVSGAASSLSQERVELPSAGIALTRPAGWHTATIAQVQANRERAKLSDPEMQAALASRSALPLIVFSKYPEPHPALNPTVQITLRQGLRGSPNSLLAGALQTMKRGFADLQIIEPVRATQVSGLPASQVRVTYTLQTQTGAHARVVSRLWLVPRGSLMFLIGMSGGESEPDVCEAEFAAALKSITIER
jgi:hypothetical protein